MLRILLTNIGLSNRTGTEIVIRDLASAFRSAGHFPMVYTPVLGSVADEIAVSGTPVVSDLQRLPFRPDVIHGHHYLETIQAVQAFPGVPAVFVCHDRIAWHDEAPPHTQILVYVAVDENCRERLLRQSWLAGKHIEVILNAVDTRRFLPRLSHAPRPRRALVFSNYAGQGTHLEPVLAACRDMRIEVVVAGAGTGNQVAAPEHILGHYDLVFAKARCALEAMASGAAVILCDNGGLGPLVTAANVQRLRPWNFGARTLTLPLDPEQIKKQIRRCDPADAAVVCDYIRSHATLEAAAASYLALYRCVLVQSGRGEWRKVSPRGDVATGRLQVADQALLSMTAPAAPAVVAPGDSFFIEVVIESRTAIPIATSPPHPALLVSRWYSRPYDKAVAPAIRSIVQPPLFQGETRSYPVRAIAPGQPGDYLLRVTLMQEGWRYLDALSPQVFAERPVSVARGIFPPPDRSRAALEAAPR